MRHSMKHSIKTAWPLAGALSLLLLLFFWQYTLLLDITGGLFTYTLDDVYIHLALSENIMKGHYGVNLSEYSAPSSSIFWSYLLAPLAQWHYWPFILNIIFSGLCIVVLNQFVQEYFPKRNALAAALVFSLIPLANLIGMAFTGMENTLQLLLSMIICLNVFRLVENKKPSSWLYLCIVIAPLVRYETLTFSCLALFMLVCRGYYRNAVLATLAMLVPLLGFSAYLNSLDLGFMPSSISAKSSALGSSAVISTLLNFYHNIYSPTGSLLLALLIPLAWQGIMLWRENPLKTWLGFIVGSAVIAHLALGRLGNWGRYEIYVFISLLMTLLYLYQDRIKNWFDSPQIPRVFGLLMLCLFVGIFAKRYLITSGMSYVGAANIAVQQKQMHHFVTDYWKKPVAVNDLGWVAYQNDEYVLDLWGLANLEALELRKQQAPDFLNTLTQQRGVELAIIYQHWFQPELLENWTLVGELHFPDDLRRMTSAGRTVFFYATTPSSVMPILNAMKAFEDKLPVESYMIFRQ